jgi:hypothetical protein
MIGSSGLLAQAAIVCAGVNPVPSTAEELHLDLLKRLLNDQVHFLVGWFRDTLPTAPIDELALLRLDGDLYESTIQALQFLYQKVSPGGYVIVDDYGVAPGCKLAVEDFRRKNRINELIQQIDARGIFRRREDS